MKKAYVNLWTVIITVTVLISSLTVIVSAEAYSDILILGDSISTGYGLGGTLYERPSYANKLAKAMKSDNLLNLAVDGATSGDLLGSIEKIADKIKGKDLIIMSIGGNDLLGTTGAVLADALKMPVGTELSVLLGTVMSMPVAELEDMFGSEAVVARYANMLNTLADNLSSILPAIKALNPDARIVVLNQYNPFSGVETNETAAAFDSVADGLISQMNDIISSVALSCDADVCDTYNAFYDQGSLYTKILSMDIHPNEAGHEVIFELLKYTIDFDENEIPETADSLYVILAGIVLSAFGIMVLSKRANILKDGDKA